MLSNVLCVFIFQCFVEYRHEPRSKSGEVAEFGRHEPSNFYTTSSILNLLLLVDFCFLKNNTIDRCGEGCASRCASSQPKLGA